MVMAITIWATVAGLKGINGEKVSFYSLVHQMIQAEPRSSEVQVYPLAGSTENPIRYYVERAGEERFRIEQRQMAALSGKHFWVAGQESPWQKEDPVLKLKTYLMGRAYQVGEVFESGPKGNRAFLFPVWSQVEESEVISPNQGAGLY